jgi:hypothetical protein
MASPLAPELCLTSTESRLDDPPYLLAILIRSFAHRRARDRRSRARLPRRRLHDSDTCRTESSGIVTRADRPVCGRVPWCGAAGAQDPVLEWIKITNDTIIATATSPLVTARTVALVSSAVFDAVNGIEPRRFESIHVTQKAPPQASPAAAAIQAAYAILVKVYATNPTVVASVTPQRDASLAAIVPGPGKSDSISVGMAWGQAVADSIWAWRSTDGFNPSPTPTFLGAPDTGCGGRCQPNRSPGQPDSA